MVKARTAQANQIRGLLSECGLIVAQGIAHLCQREPLLLDEAKDDLPGALREWVQRLLEHLKELDRQVGQMELQIDAWHRANGLWRKLEKIAGIGTITASALVASVGDANNFAHGRQFSAWLGLVPKQHWSGGKTNLLGMSKRGDTYLRTLLMDEARTVIRHAEGKADAQGWLHKLIGRRNKNVAAVALANKNARIVWALLARDRQFRSDYAAASSNRLKQAKQAGKAVAGSRLHRWHEQSSNDGKQLRPCLA